jgi:hypothetical protein
MTPGAVDSGLPSFLYTRHREQEKDMRPHRCIAALLLALVAGCATTWDVDSYQAPGSDVAARHTFAWTGGELGTVTNVDPSVVSATDQHIREVVVAGLVHRGYEEVADAKSAQMLVSYQVAGTRKYVTSTGPRFGTPSPDDVLMTSNPQPLPASELPRERRVTEGSVMVFVTDPASGQIIWRGAITAESRSSSSEQAMHTAAEMAASIVESFPARRAGK